MLSGSKVGQIGRVGLFGIWRFCPRCSYDWQPLLRGLTNYSGLLCLQDCSTISYFQSYPRSFWGRLWPLLSTALFLLVFFRVLTHIRPLKCTALQFWGRNKPSQVRLRQSRLRWGQAWQAQSMSVTLELGYHDRRKEGWRACRGSPHWRGASHWWQDLSTAFRDSCRPKPLNLFQGKLAE